MTDKKLSSRLPFWLLPNSKLFSPLYKSIWEAVQEEQPCKQYNEQLADTNRVFSLLLTSQLSTEALSYIWSLANQKYAGQLTEQELYIVLALVALAQASYPFTSLDVLDYFRVPPIPNLNLAVLNAENEFQSHAEIQISTYCNMSTLNEKPTSETTNKPIYSDINNLVTNNIRSHLTESLDDYFSSNNALNDTHVTTSADIRQKIYSRPSDVEQQTSWNLNNNSEFFDFESAPVNNFSISNLKDLKQDSAVGSRLANHNLGVKKFTDKVKKKTVSKNSTVNQIRDTASFTSAVLTIKETQSKDQMLEIFPKCVLKNQSNMIILKDTIIGRNNCEKKKTFSVNNDSEKKKLILPKITQLCSAKTAETVSVIPLNELKYTFQQDLMNLQPTEDKYSALRDWVDKQSTTSVSKPAESLNTSLAVDDFGDFISAEQEKSVSTNDYTHIRCSDYTQNSIDLLSDFNFDTETESTIQSSLLLDQEISDTSALKEINVNERIIEKLNVKFNQKKIVSQDDALSKSNNKSKLATAEVVTYTGLTSSLDLKSFSPSSQENKQFKDEHQIIYWKWIKYMESCVFLLQVAANIFTNITSEIVLREVLLTAQGYNFLCNLAEVAAVCRRVNFSYKKLNRHFEGFNNLLMDIEKIWSKMEPFYLDIPIVTELPAWPLYPAESCICAMCLTIVTNGKVTWNKSYYHATCANLWLRTVSSNLPVLKCSLFHALPPISQNVNHAKFK